MMSKNFIYTQYLLIALLCWGCSQNLLVRQDEFSNEAKQLQSVEATSILEQRDNATKSIIVAPVRFPANSSYPLAEADESDCLSTSAALEQTDLTRISASRRAKGKTILRSAVAGMFAGAVIGAMVGHARADRYAGEDAEFWGVMCGGFYGSLIGFGAGAAIGTLIAEDAVVVLDADEKYPLKRRND
ncbi:MAG: hypothetical protein ONB44_01240 [candidate division KSB1 bacterium]|nr:hypothetical protein [candidate division KSB1 bacterium]MDZ7300745.1 hypothetical protein [candidate division KSB1 bacterium]MDZ7309985.1 hypothetical protein [candidate division KSB1 bacterium]